MTVLEMHPTDGVPLAAGLPMTGLEAVILDSDRGRYYIHPKTGERHLSVTSVLGATEGKPYLVPWSARMAAEYAVDHLAEVIEVLAADGRDAAVDLLKGQAKRLRDLKADVGVYVHKVQEALIIWAARYADSAADIVLPELPDDLRGALYDDDPVEGVAEWMIDGFLNFVSDFDVEFAAAEMTVFNRALGVAGTLDAIVILRGLALTDDGQLVACPGGVLRICLDTKTGRYPDITAREQLAAYRRMHEALQPSGVLRPMPQTDAAAVLHLRPEHVGGYRLMPIAPIDDAFAWDRFCHAAEVAVARAGLSRKPGRVARALRPDGTFPPPLLADLDQEGYGRAPGALRKLAFEDLAEVAIFTADELHAMRGIGPATIEDTRRMLADYGLALAGEDAPATQGVA